MNEIKKASFSFNTFKIKYFSFAENNSVDTDVSIQIKPSGIFNKNNGHFVVSLNFSAALTKNIEVPFVEVFLEATFIHKGVTDLTSIPNYFYLNSIAIIFPYLRAFITNMTLQANIKPMILPLLNLTGLEVPFKENTIEITE